MPTLACMPASDDGPPKPVVEASGRGSQGEETQASSSSSAAVSDVPAEALRSLERVYVPLLAQSMLSLDDALAEKGYGNVMASDFEPQFQHFDTAFGPAVVAYSSGDWVESGSLFQPMSTTQWLEAALADAGARGAIINPGHAGQTLALTRAEIEDALSWLGPSAPLPMEVHRAIAEAASGSAFSATRRTGACT